MSLRYTLRSLCLILGGLALAPACGGEADTSNGNDSDIAIASVTTPNCDDVASRLRQTCDRVARWNAQLNEGELDEEEFWLLYRAGVTNLRASQGDACVRAAIDEMSEFERRHRGETARAVGQNLVRLIDSMRLLCNG